MSDCQTTGGYPRIAQVAAVDLPICAQLRPNDTVAFTEVSMAEAEQLYLEREHELEQVQQNISLIFS
jgi:antagonist of KipI